MSAGFSAIAPVLRTSPCPYMTNTSKVFKDRHQRVTVEPGTRKSPSSIRDHLGLLEIDDRFSSSLPSSSIGRNSVL